MVLQVEALFVFAILKSVVFSQLKDPYISAMVKSYRIEEEEKQQSPFFALRACELNKGQIEQMLGQKEAKKLLKEYSIFGKSAFITSI